MSLVVALQAFESYLTPDFFDFTCELVEHCENDDCKEVESESEENKEEKEKEKEKLFEDFALNRMLAGGSRIEPNDVYLLRKYSSFTGTVELPPEV